MYVVVAFDERGTAVCEAILTGGGFNAREATYVARDLRDEYPGSIVAILPSVLAPDWVRGQAPLRGRAA